jgi:hypothetical protein
MTDINDEIKEMVVDLKRNYRLKLPDGIIIPTAIYLDLSLIVADQGYKKAEQLNLSSKENLDNSQLWGAIKINHIHTLCK